MSLVFYTTLNETGQLKIPVEFISRSNGNNNRFFLSHDSVNNSVILLSCMVSSTEAEKNTMSNEWNYECIFIRKDIMAYLILPQNVCKYMLWDENTILSVSHDEKGIAVKAPDISPDDMERKRNRGIYTLPKPKKERFIEVYCQKSESVWNNDAEIQDSKSKKIERIIVDTLINTTKDNRTYIHIEDIGRFCYTAKIGNQYETITCLIKIGDSYEKQAADIYDTLLHANII